MEYTFVASRVTSGNLIFRDKIIINTIYQTVSLFKRNRIGIGYAKTTIRFRDISSFHLITRNEWLFFCSIIIETRGGSILVANGFSQKDARQISSIIEY